MKALQRRVMDRQSVAAVRYTRRQLGGFILAGPLAAATLSSKAATKDSQNTKVLEITFQGPFAFNFLDKTVRVYVPQCNGHEAYAQTDQEQILLGHATSGQPNMGYEYVMPSFRPDVVRTDCYNFTRMIAIDRGRCSNPNGPGLKDTYCQFEVPRPDLIVGLAPDPLTYTPNDVPSAPAVCGCFATAVRFYYRAFDPNHGVRLVQTQPTQPDYPKGRTIIDTSNYPELPAAQENIAISIRYNPQHPSDVPHEDAAEGFTQMRKIFPPLDRWDVSFDSCKANCQPKPKGHFVPFHHTGDCGAAQIVLAGQSELQYWQKSSAT